MLHSFFYPLLNIRTFTVLFSPDEQSKICIRKRMRLQPHPFSYFEFSVLITNESVGINNFGTILYKIIVTTIVTAPVANPLIPFITSEKTAGDMPQSA